MGTKFFFVYLIAMSLLLGKTLDVRINVTASITYSEYVSVALVIQHAKRMRRILLSSMACLALLYFYIVAHKRQDFRGKCVFCFSLQLLSETFLILRRIQGDIISVRWSLRAVKYPLFLSDFNQS
jgi:hypothetical protein